MSWGAGDTGNAGISFTEALGAGVAFGGWVGIAVAGIDLILSIFGVDPMSLIEGAITGLPSYVKTAETGQRLAQSHIPIVAALGIHFANLANNGHVLSSTPDLNQYFGPAMKYTTSALYGYEPTPINAQMQGCVFSGAPVKPIEDQYLANYPGPPVLISQAVFEQINPGHVFPTGFYDHLQKVWATLYPPGKQQPAPPPPPPTPPPPPVPPPPTPPPPTPPPPTPPPPTPPPPTPPPPTPPPPTPPPPPPPPPAPPPPPPVQIPIPPYQGPPPDDGSQDELSQIGQCLCSGLNWIIATIQTLAQQPQDPCCQQIVASLTAINSSLVAVFDQLAHPPPTPPVPDFSQIVTELQCICTALQASPTAFNNLLTGLAAPLAAIAAKIPPPADPTPIAQAIDRNTAMQDVPRAIFDKFVQDNAIPEDYAAFLQGSPGSWSDTIHHFLGFVAPPIDFVTHLIADDGNFKAAYRETRGDVAANRAMAMKTLKSLAGLPAGSGPDDLRPIIEKWISVSDATIAPLLGTALDEIKSALLPAGGAAPVLGDVHVNADDVVSKATGVALSASVAMWIASYASIDGGPPLKDMAEKIAEMAGFEELKDLVIAAYSRHGVAAVVDMQARALFRQHLPQGRDVTQWAARGLISAAETKRLLNFDGYSDEIAPPAVIAAQRGLNPRMLLQMILTGLFTPDDLGDEMTFSGIRPASQDRLKLASPYLATAKFRDATRASIEAAYVAGLLSDTDFTEQLDSIEHNTDRDNLILVGSKWKKLTAITKDLEAQYATLFEAGLIDDATLHDHLQAIGLQPDVASAVAAKSEARANAALQRRTIADARSLAKATAAQERRAATRSFVAGQIDLPALIVALTATGLTPIQAAAWSEIAQLQKTGTPRWIYGLRLPSEEATLLRSRVAALLDQRKRQLLTDPEFHDALVSLGIPPEWINSLRATADAMITPKSAAVLTPIETSK